MTVVPYTKGGLGNQCFIYAIGRSLADRVVADLMLDRYWTEDDEAFHLPFELDAFNIRINGIVPIPTKPIRLYRRLRFQLMQRVRARLGNYYCERLPFKYQSVPHKWRGSLILDGYWQSERYFADNAKQISEDLTFKDIQWVEEDPVAQAIQKAKTPTFLHIRSYKEVPGSEEGQGALPVSYFVNALAKMESMIGKELELFVFSDDLNWARKKLQPHISPNSTFVEPFKCGKVNNTHRDFQLMRLCLHGIVANSSFSWWAGWLGEQDRLAESKSPIRIRANRHCMNDDYWPSRWLPVPCEEQCSGK